MIEGMSYNDIVNMEKSSKKMKEKLSHPTIKAIKAKKKAKRKREAVKIIEQAWIQYDWIPKDGIARCAVREYNRLTTR